MRIEDRTRQHGSRGPFTTWEYNQRTMDIEADLTQYGLDGWELVAVVPIPHDSMQAIFHFKRRR